jgi:hypothetical protein
MSLTGMHSRRRGSVRVRRVAVLGATLSALALPAVASANPTNIESGRAYDINTSLLGISAKVGPDTGLISANKTTHTALSAITASSPLISASVLNAQVDTFNTESATSSASVAGANVTLPGLPVINAKVITATSSASCRAHGTVLGSSVGGTITVNGKTYPIASPPNTVIPLGIGTITLNEQIKSGNTLTVNAIHVKVPALKADVVVASAFSGVSNCA